MTVELADRLALVTGGGKGLGRQISIELARSGATVIINYRSDKLAAEETLLLVQEYSASSRIIQADVTQPPEVDRLFESIRSDYGEVDILINNVGDFIFKPLMET